MATIKDVAKKAGVSISTASYALNNKPNVHVDTRKRVLEAAKALDYYPNASARNLKTNKTNNVGFFIYGFDGPIFGDILEGVNTELQKKNYNIIVSSGKSSDVILRERQVDAAIVFDSKLDDETILTYAKSSPVIMLDRILEGNNIYCSLVKNKEMVEEIVGNQLTKGLKKIAYLSGPMDSQSNLERYEGFKNILKKHNLKQHSFYKGDFTVKKGYEIGLKIANSSNRPDFIYCANDEGAIGLLQAFEEKGVKVPEEIALAGFDGILLGDYTKPKLTTIQIDYKKWGLDLADAITTLLAKGKIPKVSYPEAIIKYKETTK